MKKSKLRSARPKLKITSDPDLNHLNSPLNSAEPLTPLHSNTIFDHILESAERKTSQEHDDVRLQSPYIVMRTEEDVDTRPSGFGATPYPDNIREDTIMMDEIIHSDSENEEAWYSKSPPSYMTVDDTVDELLRETQPPPDHYSNPLYRKADKLKKNNVDHTNSNSSIDLSVADFSMNDLKITHNLNSLQSHLCVSGN
ncbi:unnamed protein product [Bursaphelenchus okinawaensis]|uniref:Uncharacterized protein n=1 Tax=Bursaphelenchus okinawaensis TaxID=465554 RepID=A0A811LLY9_9BILA|nr:unnamed protein product [Bursaphelenchus okinawaensis]CAG9126785.1 unnamed protein product [Bursaphelenchus okinawaensis]